MNYYAITEEELIHITTNMSLGIPKLLEKIHKRKLIKVTAEFPLDRQFDEDMQRKDGHAEHIKCYLTKGLANQVKKIIFIESDIQEHEVIYKTSVLVLP